MHFHTQLNIFLHKKKKKKRNRFHNFIKNHKKVLKILSLDSISHPKKYKRTYIYIKRKRKKEYSYLKNISWAIKERIKFHNENHEKS